MKTTKHQLAILLAEQSEHTQRLAEANLNEHAREKARNIAAQVISQYDASNLNAVATNTATT